MRSCPECGEQTISTLKLALQNYIPGVVAACRKCHAMVDFKSRDGVFSMILAEWIILGLLILSLMYFGMLWIGIAIFIIWRLIRIYFRVKGPLVNVHHNS